MAPCVYVIRGKQKHHDRLITALIDCGADIFLFLLSNTAIAIPSVYVLESLCTYFNKGVPTGGSGRRRQVTGRQRSRSQKKV